MDTAKPRGVPRGNRNAPKIGADLRGEIQVSADGTTWTNVYSTSTSAGGNETIAVSGTGRYIRLYGTTRATAYGYSIWEFQVFGS